MQISYQLSPDDRTAGFAAHRVWQRGSFIGRYARKLFGWILFASLAISLFFALQPPTSPISYWTVRPISLIGAALAAPIAVLLLLASVVIGALRPPIKPSPGIVEAKVPKPPTTPENKPKQYGRGLFGWVLFIGLAVFLFVILQQGSKPHFSQAPEPAGVANGELLGGFETWFLIVGPLVVVFIIWNMGISWLRRRNLVTTDEPNVTLTMTADEDEIVIGRTGIVTHFRWSAIKWFIATETHFLIYAESEQYHLIPAGAFPDPDSADWFGSLLTRKVPTGVIEPRRKRGFPIQPVGHASPVIMAPTPAPTISDGEVM